MATTITQEYRQQSLRKKKSWTAGLNKRAGSLDNYRHPFPASAPTTTTTTPSPDAENSQQNSDLIMQPVRVVLSPSVIETTAMDVLVDGMNGGEEDIFASMDALRGTRRRKKSLKSSSTSSSNTSSFVHHPLYHPPLPKPPPGIRLGVTLRDDSDADEDPTPNSTPRPRRISRQKSRSKHSLSSKASTNPSTSNPTTVVDSIDDAIRRYVSASHTPPKEPVPSINDIIRTYSPRINQHKPGLLVNISSSPISFPTLSPSPPSRPPSRSFTIDRSSLDDNLSRSSMDSVAEEVQHTLMLSLSHPSTVTQRTKASLGDDRDSFTTTIAKRSDNLNRSPSVSSFSTSHTPPSPFNNQFRSSKSDSHTHALATFLRSPRLTRLLKLRRHPNQRLQVSFSDLGSSSGRPIVVFLGLGCVRYIMGLYDEMAEALGLRLITIDRWGLGKTDNPSRGTPRGVREWAAIVEEVLDYLNIERYGILAHSAGAPYAMAFANRAPHKVQGDLCLLAPWVGPAEGGYKWLKYVPTSLIKTAQAAEWKVQAWMLGKPPAINTGIGYSPPPSSSDRPRPSLAVSVKSRDSFKESRVSSTFSDYDDLADFQGKYASRSTIHVCDDEPSSTTTTDTITGPHQRSRSRSGRFFSGLWKSGEQSASNSPSPVKTSPTRPRLKVLKSMGSLRNNSVSSTMKSKGTRSQTTSIAGTIEDDWSAMGLSPIASPIPSVASSQAPFEGSRGNGRARRSISLSSPKSASPYTSNNSTSQSKNTYRLSSPPPTLASSTQAPSASSFESSPTSNGAALGNALLAASHAEASRGTHADLLQILNHNQKPWGFSYHDFPHSVQVWYGEKDEKIAEGTVRWLERTMRPGTCEVKIVKGAGHTLLYNGGVVVEALETLKDFWNK
ncbi:hypothetical protein Clacol_003853 [Clathrus columnatus]|uniref:AB hydrolase-1 domain-containing protein n=1 Tax=Clathrus columnatus TaxID=1419009 RepID=A0AAV5A4S9_9AGAM|nr:hypothetical protein Clacol_003853 [Clathrus columnatus]